MREEHLIVNCRGIHASIRERTGSFAGVFARALAKAQAHPFGCLILTPAPLGLGQLAATTRIDDVLVVAVILTTGFVVERSLSRMNGRPRSVRRFLHASRVMALFFLLSA
ncbi:MAG: hypothetical protein ABIV93_10875 [Byssovorax sp.]